jgi:hypothetical protein
MMGLVHTVSSRLAAVAVALALSGVPHLVEGPEHHEGHRCQCPVRNSARECDCPLCHQEAARLGKVAAGHPSQPPCHRAPAALARAEASKKAQQAATEPCLSSSCGTTDGKLLPVPAAERFLVPGGWEISVVEVVRDVTSVQVLPASLLREPETPPPRRS